MKRMRKEGKEYLAGIVKATTGALAVDASFCDSFCDSF
jgi:hypothetical protein